MRKSIRILGSYVDDIDRAMKLFAEGHFDVQPEVEWKGDFIGILHSFMGFEKSMAATLKGIQNVSGEVSGAAEQVASSSNDLADGVTNQAAVVANQVNMCNLLEYLTQRDIQTKNSGVNVRYRGKHRFFKGFNEFIKEKTRRCDNDFEKIERHVFF